jgi:hypothetical protein
MLELVGRCRTAASLELPRTPLPTERLRGLRPGSVLDLGLAARTAAQFRADGVLLFTSAAVGRSDRRAAQLLARAEVKP